MKLGKLDNIEVICVHLYTDKHNKTSIRFIKKPLCKNENTALLKFFDIVFRAIRNVKSVSIYYYM